MLAPWCSGCRRNRGATVRERVNVIIEAIQELAMNMDGADPSCNKGGRSPGGSICRAVNETEEQNLRLCVFTAPVRVLDSLL